MKNRLKIARTARRYTQKQVADIVGITQNAYSYWETGKVRIDSASLTKLADFLRVPLDFLCGREYKLMRPISEWRRDQQEDWQNANENERIWLDLCYGQPKFISEVQDYQIESNQHENYSSPITTHKRNESETAIPAFHHPSVRTITQKRLPMLGNVACGEPIFADEEHGVYVDAMASLDADFCLTAHGDSMINARIFDGDILFVKSQNSVENGEIAVVLIGDEATVKRVYFDHENGVLTLIPENPTIKTMRYTGEQLNDIRILGKVVFGQYIVMHDSF